MSKQGKLPLNKDEARLKLKIGESADGEQVTPSETDIDAPAVTPDEVLSSDTSSEITEDGASAPKYTSAEEMGQREESAPQTLGENLRHERERQQLSLHDVADQLRLRPKQIEALENGDYDSLPGHTFVSGFLRSYANLLRLDAVAIVELYRSESQAGRQTTELAFPEPTPEGRVPGGGLILVALGLVAALFAGWYFYLEENRLELEQVANLPGELLDKISDEEQIIPTSAETLETAETSVDVTTPELLPSETPPEEASPVLTEAVKPEMASEAPVTTTDEGATTEMSPVADNAPDVAVSAADILADKQEILAEKTELPTDMKAETEAATDVAEVIAVPSDEPDANTAEPIESDAVEAPVEKVPSVLEPTPAPTPNYPQSTLTPSETTGEAIATAPSRGADLGVENADSRVVLVAVQETWIQVADATGEVLFDSILSAGDSYMLPNRSDLQLSAANAGGLEVRLDGQSIGMLGLNGVIVQSMPVTDESLREKIVSSD